MARSKNMQKLTDQTKARYPGVVVYGIGDAAHQLSPSGHNEDDTPGSRPEQEDPDSKPEHRAIDVMLGPAFSRAQAWEYVTALVTDPANRARLLYVIFDGWIWRARNGWKREVKTGDPHRDHPHVSGTWQDDENTSPWNLETPQGDDDVSEPIVVKAAQIIEGWANGMATAQSGGHNVEPVKWRARDEQWQKSVNDKLAELAARPAGTLTLTPEDKADLIAGFGAAAEAAVRKVLGAVDGATPEVG